MRVRRALLPLPLLDGGRRPCLRRLVLGHPPDGGRCSRAWSGSGACRSWSRASPGRRTAGSWTSTSTCTTGSTGRSPRCRAPRSSSTRASRPRSCSPCGTSTASTSGSSTWSGTRAGSPTRGPRPTSASRSRPTAPSWAPTRPHRLAVLWATLQLESAFLARGRAARRPRALRGPRRRTPRPRSSEPCATSACRRRPVALDHVGERSVTLGPSHGVAGSRTRFTEGRIELRLDDAWRIDAGRRARAGS